jgi:hypothetical protein
MSQSPITDEGLDALVDRSKRANEAFMRGDMDGYLALVRHAEDYTPSPDGRGHIARSF